MLKEDMVEVFWFGLLFCVFCNVSGGVGFRVLNDVVCFLRILISCVFGLVKKKYCGVEEC